MVHHIVLYKLKSGIEDEDVEEMMRAARSQLLKIPEVLTIRSGKRIDEKQEWPFYVAIEFGSLVKMAMCHDDPIYAKYRQEVIEPNTIESLDLTYELEPSRNVKYS